MSENIRIGKQILFTQINILILHDLKTCVYIFSNFSTKKLVTNILWKEELNYMIFNQITKFINKVLRLINEVHRS